MAKDEGVYVGRDLNKAFDRADNLFLYEVLRQYVFGVRFVSWIWLLYSTTSSKVNGVLTDDFLLERLVHQGCLLCSILLYCGRAPIHTHLERWPH